MGDSLLEDVETGDVHRARLRVDTKRWLLSKALPKIYGDRFVQEIVGPNGGPITRTTVVMPAVDHLEDLAARFKTIEHRPSRIESPRPAPAKHISPADTKK
jgi:hypothetical protein